MQEPQPPPRIDAALTPPPIPSSNRDLLQAFLASHDAACPRCNYNLRGGASDRCPECGQHLRLSISDPDPRTAWDILALFAVVLTTLYFAVRVFVRILVLIGGVYRGTSLAELRVDLAVNALVELAITIGGALWCIFILRNRAKKPRPIWARPTTAAAGLLLAVFIAFLLAYGIRTLL